MGMGIEGVEAIESYEKVDGISRAGETQAVHIDDLPEAERKTHRIGPPVIRATDQPSSNDSMGNRVITEGAVNPAVVDTTVTNEGEPNEVVRTVIQFPNLAFEAIKMGLTKEKITNDKLNQHILECEENQKNIDLLLDLNAELAVLSDNKNGELSPKAMEKIKALKERGIDLWRKEGSKITKEELVKIKSLISSFRDKNQTELQTRFTTKIQVIIQSMSSIMETLKKITQESKTLMDVISRHCAEGK